MKGYAQMCRQSRHSLCRVKTCRCECHPDHALRARFARDPGSGAAVEAAKPRPPAIPFGLPTVLAALTGQATIREMAFSLGIPILEPGEVAEFCEGLR